MSDALLPPVEGPIPTPDTKPTTRKPRRKGGRVGRGSLEAPIRSMLEPVTELWALADPICGQAAVDAVPGIAKAINIRCQESADAYEFWSKVVGSGGNFGIALAIAPLAQAVAFHHVVPFVMDFRARQAERRGTYVEPEPEPEPEPSGRHMQAESEEPDERRPYVNPGELADVL